MSFKRLSETQAEIRGGGGCLSVFGLPFFAAGLFMMLWAAGLIPAQDDLNHRIWARTILAVMGLVFAAVGGALVFGRSRMVIDTAEGMVRRHLGLLSMPIQSRTFPLSTFNAVELGFEMGDSDSPDTYPVTLRGAEASSCLRISSGSDYAASLEEARGLALFLHLPLEDASSDHRTVLTPEEVNMPLADRLKGSRESDRAARPVSPRSKVEMAQGVLEIKIPKAGFRPIMLLPALIPMAILYYVLPDLLDFFQRSATPEQVQWIFVGFLLLIFGFFPAVSLAGSLVRSRRGYTGVRIADRRVLITEQHAWRRKVTVIEGADITGLDYGTVQGRSEQAAMEMQKLKMTGSAAYVAVSPRQLPAWAAALTSWSKSKGVTIKHRRGLYTFGAGLPDDEVKYLYGLVRQALAGDV